jgi:peptidoglycan hydrolase-like protein with peptidoglycan-binding domain
MSRSYTVLAAALLVVAGLVGVAQVMSGGEPGGEAVAVAAESAPAVATATTAVPPDVPAESGVVAEVDPECTLSIRLEVGMTDPQVVCLEVHLLDAGALTGVDPDDVFDSATEAAVEAFQEANGLVVDGVVGPQTAEQLGAWIGPDVFPPDPDTCAETGRSAVIDRFNQRAWLCDDGAITEEMPITSAVSQPDPGTYEVYAKDLNASSTLTGEYSTMTHFVAFTYGKYQGARIAFHSVPTYSNGEYVQPLDSVGSPEQYGDSSGCIRVLPDDAELIWDWLDVGDPVTVIS